MSSNRLSKIGDLNPLVLIFVLTLFATVLTYVLPAGEFERAVDQSTGRTAVVAGTYHTVEQSPVSLPEFAMSFNRGIINSAAIISFLLLIGGSFGILNSTGAVGALMTWLVTKFRSERSRQVLIVLLIAFFEICGGTFGMSLEAMVFVPFLISLAVRMGYDPLVGVALPVIGCNLGYGAAYLNPFSLGIAQGIAGLPFTSGISVRVALMIGYLIVSSALLLRYAEKVRKDPSQSLCEQGSYEHLAAEESQLLDFTNTHKAVLAVFIAGISYIVYGTIFLGFMMAECSTVFGVMGVLAGIIARKTPSMIASEFIDGAKSVVSACLLVGFANAINAIMSSGKIMDTIIYYLTLPLSDFSPLVCAPLMAVIQTLVNFFINSGSAQAVVMMPLMVPIADILEVNRQVAVLAYQIGDGLSNMLWITAPLMLISIGIAKVPYTRYLKFISKIFLANLALGMLTCTLAQALNWGPF